MKEVVIVSAVRTPMGSFGGVLSSVPATKLGGFAIKGAIEKCGLNQDQIDEVFMGNVLQANLGQAPARQAAIEAGLSENTPCTTINKVCSSGMKSIMIGAQTIISGDNEIVNVEVPQRKGDNLIINEDEEYKKVILEKIPNLRPVFAKDGTITAANASTINDGASALVLMSLEKANELNLKPLAKIISYADAAHEPEWFTTAPSNAIENALKKGKISKNDVDYFELNEAFSVVGLANIKLLDIDNHKVNVNGGAVALGHPLGSSGSRIVVTLINVLKQNNGSIGVAGICNGGGGASAIIIKNM